MALACSVCLTIQCPLPFFFPRSPQFLISLLFFPIKSVVSLFHLVGSFTIVFYPAFPFLLSRPLPLPLVQFHLAPYHLRTFTLNLHSYLSELILVLIPNTQLSCHEVLSFFFPFSFYSFYYLSHPFPSFPFSINRRPAVSQ